MTAKLNNKQAKLTFISYVFQKVETEKKENSMILFLSIALCIPLSSAEPLQTLRGHESACVGVISNSRLRIILG